MINLKEYLKKLKKANYPKGQGAKLWVQNILYYDCQTTNFLFVLGDEPNGRYG
jgi:hypothetical protein